MVEPHRHDLLALGEAVRELRERHGLTGGEFAVQAGLPAAELAALESGRLDPSFELLLALAEAIGERPSAFFVLAEGLSARRARRAPDSQ